MSPTSAPLLVRLENGLNWVSDRLGTFSALLFLLLLVNVFYDVLARYLWNDVSIALQELEWHLFAAMFLFGVPYTLKAGGHVRVDLIYERLSPNARAWIDLMGTLVFLFPFCLLVGWFGIDFVKEAYELGESSGDPGGLSHRWIIKAAIPVSFGFMAVSGLGLLLNSVNTLLGHHKPIYHKTEL
ncbi:TRAP transporter small permease subunit [Oceanospirillum sanctuarii]|uniref:TRAP transporter small permease subunit n=1 Tax=Oceanospirillum sanctuarii TaxID=1434821 RepID=UPI000A36ACB2|nr:TRAP transporter small permease subunit [Oceanospirillum sanctuarii]